MSWKDKMKEFGGGDITFLSEDGEVLDFVVVGEPVLLEGKYKGKPSEKIGCPVVTFEGFMIFVAGKRLARKIAKHEDELETKAFRATRHGVQGDIEATYDLQILDDTDRTAKLFEIKQTEFNPDMIPEAVESAKQVVKG